MAADSLRDESLTDFFYADRPRLQSFLTQLFPEGHLQALRVMSKKSASYTGKGAGHVPLVADFEAQGVKASEDVIERHYGADWLAPLNFLAALTEKNLLTMEVSEARLGAIVLMRGHIQVVDFGTLQRLWAPVHRALIGDHIKAVRDGMTREQRRKGADAELEKLRKQKQEEADGMGGVLSVLPPLVQMKCFNGTEEAWGTLTPEHMLSDFSELAFKHGRGLPGEWTVVGLLDALPDDVIDAAPHVVNTEVENGLLQVMDAMRTFLGRRPYAYGITPLLIYRQVFAPSD